jgi:hypothetical protein
MHRSCAQHQIIWCAALAVPDHTLTPLACSHALWLVLWLQVSSDDIIIPHSPNPNDEHAREQVVIIGDGPGHRAGHTATVVNRQLFVFGGSYGSDYLW